MGLLIDWYVYGITNWPTERLVIALLCWSKYEQPDASSVGPTVVGKSYACIGTTGSYRHGPIQARLHRHGLYRQGSTGTAVQARLCRPGSPRAALKARLCRHGCTGTLLQAPLYRHTSYRHGSTRLSRHGPTGAALQARLYRHGSTGTALQARLYRHESTGTALQARLYHRDGSTGSALQVRLYRKGSTGTALQERLIRHGSTQAWLYRHGSTGTRKATDSNRPVQPNQPPSTRRLRGEYAGIGVPGAGPKPDK